MKSFLKKLIKQTPLVVRKYTHLVQFYAQVGLGFIAKKIVLLFFRLFPKAEIAFQKRDHLQGLKHGPSSFFLKNLSEHKEKKALHK